MPAIHHMHSRFIHAPLARVRCLLEALWSGQPGDAFPHHRIRPWRRAAPGGRGFSLGTSFGHGPFRFVVDSCDDHSIFARIDTPGYVGRHGFDLVEERGGTRVVHTLNASATLPNWFIWTLLIGSGHDWAVRSCLTRLDSLAQKGTTEALHIDPVPWQLRTFIDLHHTARRVVLRSAT